MTFHEPKVINVEILVLRSKSYLLISQEVLHQKKTLQKGKNKGYSLLISEKFFTLKQKCLKCINVLK